MIYIISNVSEKIERVAGRPYCIVNGRSEDIVSDKIKIDTNDNHLKIELGYQQHGIEKHANLKVEIKNNAQDMYFIYKAPFLLNGTGKLKQVSKGRYRIYSMLRYAFNHTVFLLICIIILIIAKVFFL